MIRLDPKAVDRIRTAKGWSWSDFARQVPLSSVTRTKIANGRPVSIGTARRVAKRLRRPLYSLLAAEDADGAGAEINRKPEARRGEEAGILELDEPDKGMREVP